MAVNIIEGGSPDKTYEAQSRSDKSVQRDIFGEKDENRLMVPRFIYSKLGNFSDAKNMTRADIETEKNEYKLFIKEMDDVDNLQRQGLSIPANLDNIVEIDKYLGSLGTEKEYPFMDDAYFSEQWLDPNKLHKIRNVVDYSSVEVKNVIAIINGITYNVVTTRQGA
jgi:hypothetical protein